MEYLYQRYEINQDTLYLIVDKKSIIIRDICISLYNLIYIHSNLEGAVICILLLFCDHSDHSITKTNPLPKYFVCIISYCLYCRYNNIKQILHFHLHKIQLQLLAIYLNAYASLCLPPTTKEQQHKNDKQYDKKV